MRLHLSRNLACIVVGSILAVLMAPSLGTAEEAPSPAVGSADGAPTVPSPAPLLNSPAAPRPGATYVGATALGAPVRIEVAGDGQTVLRYEFGSLDPSIGRVPALTWEPRCSMFGGNVLGFTMARNVPIVDGRFEDRRTQTQVEGVFDGDTAIGTLSGTMKADDPSCQASTDWTAFVSP